MNNTIRCGTSILAPQNQVLNTDAFFSYNPSVRLILQPDLILYYSYCVMGMVVREWCRNAENGLT